MNTQNKPVTNRPTASVHFTGQSVCAQALPIPFVPSLQQAGIAEAIRDEGGSRFKLWMNRIGMAGFLFFFVKGLVWLAIFTFGAEAIRNVFN